MAVRWLWTQAENMGPGRRQEVVLGWHPNASEVLLFGGLQPADPNSSASAKYADDTWSWNGQYWAQIQDVGPSSRGMAALAPDRSGGLLLFGGRNGAAARRDTWLWDGANWTQVADIGPDWYEPAMAFDPDQQMTVLVNNAGDTIKETYYWDGSSWTQVDDRGPTMISRFLAWDMPTSVMLLCGREPGSTRMTTYIWAQQMWVPVNDMGPSDAVQGLLSSPAGVLARTRSDTWLWDGQRRRWTRVQDMGGKAEEASTAWDATRGVGVMFIGASGETWKLTPPS